jgi:hypothetical protein
MEGIGGCEAHCTHLESRRVGMTKTPNSQLGNGGWAMETLPLIWGGRGVGCKDHSCSFGADRVVVGEKVPTHWFRGKGCTVM